MRRIARVTRWVAGLLAAAVLLGVGVPVLRAPVDAAIAPAGGAPAPAGLEELAASVSGASVPVPALHPSLPRGYHAPAPALTPAATASGAQVTSPSPAAVPVPPPAAQTAPVPAAVGPAPAAVRPAPAAVGPVPAAVRPAPAAVRPAPAPVGPTPRATATLPLPVVVGRSTQVVTVVAPSAGSTLATLTAWTLGPGGWTVAVGPVSARVGADGVGLASEATSRTPAGTFTLTEGFGRLGHPGTRLPYRVINANDYWVSDVASPRYNMFVECAPGTCPFNTAAGEHLWNAGSSYDEAVVIDYNRWPAVPGRGSAFFLHVTNGAPTAGCVAIPRPSLTAILRWLDPAARPLISIGIG